MRNTKEAWQLQQPIYSRLPGYHGDYSRNDTVKHIVQYWDEFLVFQKTKVDDLLTKNLDPLLCDAEYLDFLAYLSFYNKRFWDKTWKESAKRKLINGSNLVWNFFGTFTSLGYVISCFDIKHQLQNVGDFIVGISQVGDPLGDITWSYRIYLPSIYQGTETEDLVHRLNYLFGVGYCESEVIFDDSRFIELQVITTDDNIGILTDNNEGVILDG